MVFKIKKPEKAFGKECGSFPAASGNTFELLQHATANAAVGTMRLSEGSGKSALRVHVQHTGPATSRVGAAAAQ